MRIHSSSAALLTLFEKDQNSLQTLRNRLCSALRQAITNGALANEQRLPSSRQLAADLNISRITVEAAYGQIEAEGYLRRQTGKGTFVSIAVPISPLGKQPKATAPRFARLSTRGEQIVATGGCYDPQEILPFAAGSPDLRIFPLKIWQQLTNKQMRIHGDKLLRYGDPQGFAPLREAVCAYLQQSRGVRCNPQQILITTSSQQALQLLATLLLDVGDNVWLEQPGYVGARNAFASAGGVLCPMAVDEQGLIPTPHSPTPKMIYLTPSHHYPSGVSLSLSRRLQILDYARKHQAWIIEDDYDSELHYDGRPLPAMQGLDKHQQVIYLGTFSKVLFPSLRLAYVVLPEALVQPMVTLRTVYDGHSSQWMQAVTADFIQAGHFASHLRLSRQLYHSRRDHLLSQINDKLSGWLTPQPSAGGLQLAAQLPAGSEQTLSQLALRQGVMTPRLSPLWLPERESPDNRIRPVRDGWLLGFSALTPSEITAAIDRLARITV